MPPYRFQAHPADHRFFATMAVLTAATIAAGFASTYGPKLVTGTPVVPPVIHLHAAVFTIWLAVFVAQTLLVMTGRTALHRRIGPAGVAFAGLMLVVGLAAAITAGRAGHRGIPGLEFPDAEGFLLLNVAAILIFSVLVAAGWFYRRDAQAHKRLMLTAMVGGLVGPGVSRLPFASGHTPVIAALVMAFLFAGPAYDLITRRRVHPAYIWGVMLALTTIPPVVEALSATAAWRGIAALMLR